MIEHQAHSQVLRHLIELRMAYQSKGLSLEEWNLAP